MLSFFILRMDDKNVEVRFFDNSLKELSDDIDLSSQRSFLYGDGHFTTAKVIDGKIEHLELHISRLNKANKALKFNPLIWHKLQSLLENTAIDLSSGVIKVQISRGMSQRGYGNLAQTQPLIIVSSSSIEPSWFKEQQQPMDLPIAQTRLGIQPLLAGMKHCNRLEQVIIAQEIEQQNWQDALVLDIHDHVIETNKANVFWYDGKQWFTPSLENSGVEGVQRQFILDNVDVKITNVTIQDMLNSVVAMFVCNSLIGIKAINKVGDKSLSLAPVEKIRVLL